MPSTMASARVRTASTTMCVRTVGENTRRLPVVLEAQGEGRERYPRDRNHYHEEAPVVMSLLLIATTVIATDLLWLL